MSPTTESTPETGPADAAAVPSPESEPLARPPSQRHRELFRMLLSVLKDPERAYTVSEEIMSTAGENVVAQIGARLDSQAASVNARFRALEARFEALEASVNARFEALEARFEALVNAVANTNARLERLENQLSRLIWGVLGLQTALVVAIFTLVLSR